VDIEVVRALDGWPARRWEFAGEDTWRGAGEDLGKDGADRRASSVSDGDAATAGRPTHVRGWAGMASGWAGHGENGPRWFFPIQILFQLNKSAWEDKNRRNTWDPQKNVKFGMDVDLNICHNFHIGHVEQRSTIFKWKLYSSLGLDIDGSRMEILLNLTQIQDYTMTNTWWHGFDVEMLHHREVIRFVEEHIIHRFGVPQTLTIDQGASFMSHWFKEFAGALKIKLLNSSPYYAQANGQAESSNKILIKLIKKKVNEYPRRWHEALSEALWAHRTSKHGATKVTQFELLYGQEDVLPVEVNLQACRVVG
jgi:hypothetical protein